ncbi:MAG TPA: hypothetical protein VMJ64_19055 [Anaerolineales bacterium]|nr:hypothetical protein [Anaerolineales bacterium]
MNFDVTVAGVENFVISGGATNTGLGRCKFAEIGHWYPMKINPNGSFTNDPGGTKERASGTINGEKATGDFHYYVCTDGAGISYWS